MLASRRMHDPQHRQRSDKASQPTSDEVRVDEAVGGKPADAKTEHEPEIHRTRCGDRGGDRGSKRIVTACGRTLSARYGTMPSCSGDSSMSSMSCVSTAANAMSRPGQCLPTHGATPARQAVARTRIAGGIGGKQNVDLQSRSVLRTTGWQWHSRRSRREVTLDEIEEVVDQLRRTVGERSSCRGSGRQPIALLCRIAAQIRDAPRNPAQPELPGSNVHDVV